MHPSYIFVVLMPLGAVPAGVPARDAPGSHDQPFALRTRPANTPLTSSTSPIMYGTANGLISAADIDLVALASHELGWNVFIKHWQEQVAEGMEKKVVDSSKQDEGAEDAYRMPEGLFYYYRLHVVHPTKDTLEDIKIRRSEQFKLDLEELEVDHSSVLWNHQRSLVTKYEDILSDYVQSQEENEKNRLIALGLVEHDQNREDSRTPEKIRGDNELAKQSRKYKENEFLVELFLVHIIHRMAVDASLYHLGEGATKDVFERRINSKGRKEMKEIDRHLLQGSIDEEVNGWPRDKLNNLADRLEQATKTNHLGRHMREQLDTVTGNIRKISDESAWKDLQQKKAVHADFQKERSPAGDFWGLPFHELVMPYARFQMDLAIAFSILEPKEKESSPPDAGKAEGEPVATEELGELDGEQGKGPGSERDWLPLEGEEWAELKDESDWAKLFATNRGWQVEKSPVDMMRSAIDKIHGFNYDRVAKQEDN